jgi:hypothetical protein
MLRWGRIGDPHITWDLSCSTGPRLVELMGYTGEEKQSDVLEK